MLGSTPLLLTPDTREYITWAQELLAGNGWKGDAIRTPGYSLLLVLSFLIFGEGPMGILLVQHALGLLLVAAVTASVCRVATPVIGAVVGLLIAIDPWLLGFTHMALSELPTVAFVSLAAACVPMGRERPAWGAIGLGISLTIAILMRPACVVLVPSFLLAWLAAVPGTWRRKLVLAALASASLAAASSPWFVYNARRGHVGYATQSGWLFWAAVAIHGLVDRDYPADPKLKEAYERIIGNDPSEVNVLLRYVSAVRPREQREVSDALTQWALHSVRSRPAQAARAGFDTLRWLLNVGDPRRPAYSDEFPWLVGGLFRFGQGPCANFQGTGSFPRAERFGMPLGQGVMRCYLELAADNTLRGLPHVPLFLATLLASGLAAWRRHWTVFWISLASIGFLAAHVALLFPATRYSLPAIPLWYVSAGWLVHAVATWRGPRPGTQHRSRPAPPGPAAA